MKSPRPKKNLLLTAGRRESPVPSNSQLPLKDPGGVSDLGFTGVAPIVASVAAGATSYPNGSVGSLAQSK